MTQREMDLPDCSLGLLRGGGGMEPDTPAGGSSLTALRLLSDLALCCDISSFWDIMSEVALLEFGLLCSSGSAVLRCPEILSLSSCCSFILATDASCCCFSATDKGTFVSANCGGFGILLCGEP